MSSQLNAHASQLLSWSGSVSLGSPQRGAEALRDLWETISLQHVQVAVQDHLVLSAGAPRVEKKWREGLGWGGGDTLAGANHTTRQDKGAEGDPPRCHPARQLQ